MSPEQNKRMFAYLGIINPEEDLIDPSIAERIKLWQIENPKECTNTILGDIIDEQEDAIDNISAVLIQSMTKEEWSKSLPKTIEFQRWQYYKSKWKLGTVFPAHRYVAYPGKKGPSRFEYERGTTNIRLCTRQEEPKDE